MLKRSVKLEPFKVGPFKIRQCKTLKFISAVLNCLKIVSDDFRFNEINYTKSKSMNKKII